MLRGDMEARYKAYAIGRQWGILSANDCRAWEDLVDLGEAGDDYIVPLNMANADPEKLAALAKLVEPSE